LKLKLISCAVAMCWLWG